MALYAIGTQKHETILCVQSDIEFSKAMEQNSALLSLNTKAEIENSVFTRGYLQYWRQEITIVAFIDS